MRHTCSNLVVLLTTLVVFGPIVTHSQVRIKERVEIHPLQPARNALQQAQDDSLFQSGNCAVTTRRPCIVTVTCSLPAYDPANNIPQDGLAFYLDCVGAPQYQYFLGATGVSGITTQTVTFPAGTCASMRVEVGVAGWGAGASLFGQCTLSGTTTTATIQLDGQWRNKRPITALVTLTAVPDTAYDLASLAISASPGTITQCYDYTTINITALDNRGQPYWNTACYGDNRVPMTVSVPSTTKVTIEYPSGDTTIRGQSLTLPAGNQVMYLRFNYAPGDPVGPVEVTVAAGDKIALTTVTLTIDPAASYITGDVSPGEVRHNLKSILRGWLADGCGRRQTPASTTTFKFEVADAQHLGYLFDPATGRSGSVLDQVAPVQGIASVEYRAYGAEPTGYQDVPVTISISDGSVAPFQTDVYVLPNDIRVTATPNPIHFGESTQLTIEMNNGDGTYSAIPSDWPTAFQLVSVDTTGYLFSPDSQQTGSTVYGAFQTASYYARPRTIEPDSVDVAVYVTTVDPNVIPTKVNDGGKPRPTFGTHKTITTVPKGANKGPAKNTIAMDQPPDLGPGLPYYGVGRVVVKREGGQLDHFLLTTDKDTLRHGDTTSIKVVAKDRLGNDVLLDAGTILRFSADSTQYATFINVTGDTVRSPLENVSYADAREGKLRLAADKTNPIGRDPKKITITVVESGDSTKSGNKAVFVKRKVVLAIQRHAPWDIWPYLPSQINGNGTRESRGADRPGYNARRNFSILVTDGLVQPVCNEQISIFTTYEESTGGHGHGGYADTGGTIPALKAMPDSLQGVFYRLKQAKNPLTITTDSLGIAVVDSFIASQASGKYLITAQTVSDTTVMDTVNLRIRVPDLVDFGTGDYWSLTGATSEMGQNHPSNHWCTQKTKDSLSAVLKAFYDWCASEKGGGKAVKIGVNDMAIEWGGAFDIPGRWKFGVEHSFHRIGVSVDIDQSPGNLRKKDGTLNPTGERLKEIMDTYGGKKYKESSIHFGFDNGI